MEAKKEEEAKKQAEAQSNEESKEAKNILNEKSIHKLTQEKSF